MKTVIVNPVLFLLLNLLYINSFAQISKESLGHWEGKAAMPQDSMQLIINVSRHRVQYDAPEQGIYASEVTEFNFAQDHFSFTIPGREPIRVEGKITGNQMIGESKGRLPMTFSLQRTSVIPVFYTEEEVTYKSGDVILSGTLIKPDTKGPHAAVVMIHGSGNVGRMTRERTRNMALLFVQSGIAALIYDRRGNGKSTGENDRLLRMETLAKDAAAGAKYLASRRDLIKDKIGFYGLSQGGWVAPYASELFGNTGFVVTISAAGVTPDEQDAFVQNKPVQHEGSKEEIIPGFSAFDPLPYWAKVKAPVLAIWGEKDLIIPVEKSKQLIGEALVKGNNPHYTANVFADANHEIKIGNGPLAKLAPGSRECIIQWVRGNVLLMNK